MGGVRERWAGRRQRRAGCREPRAAWPVREGRGQLVIPTSCTCFAYRQNGGRGVGKQDASFSEPSAALASPCAALACLARLARLARRQACFTACLARLTCLDCLVCLAYLFCLAFLAPSRLSPILPASPFLSCLACLDCLACLACLTFLACLCCLACLFRPSCTPGAVFISLLMRRETLFMTPRQAQSFDHCYPTDSRQRFRSWFAPK